MLSDVYVLAAQNHRFMVERGAVASCLSCCQFDLETEVCKKAGQRPPAETIVYGCPAWDDVPF